ncbi:hypothetical protein TIFTF001_017778 [Ficus carica]|uniref:Uncharacterized protein n=1 Tax=Ficus carica TaxID=3494 RepID=A0AA88DJ35_FICCA|nr:hypothetical protein TIFTF001_017778 [Ficus carica]
MGNSSSGHLPVHRPAKEAEQFPKKGKLSYASGHPAVALRRESLAASDEIRRHCRHRAKEARPTASLPPDPASVAHPPSRRSWGFRPGVRIGRGDWVSGSAGLQIRGFRSRARRGTAALAVVVGEGRRSQGAVVRAGGRRGKQLPMPERKAGALGVVWEGLLMFGAGAAVGVGEDEAGRRGSR